ncbi:MAG: undecaprenyl-diphosphate phosphatase [Puniceicoccales bacterium]|jgi:undecaprenyl-diphosphatase|nr:undecaprenyl-diphosphate phosphatase [Puniceicoccales bacterium]
MKKFLLVLTFAMAFLTNSYGENIFTTKEAIILGITQGTTEFLPISSTGHLILVDRFLLSHESSPLGGADDSKASKVRAKNAYFVIIQFGSILAVLFLYRRRFTDMFLGLFGHNYHGRNLMFNLIASFLPAAMVGPFISGWLKTLYHALPVAIALIIGGIIMIRVEKSYRKRWMRGYGRIDNLTFAKSFFIGLWQCLAFIPGTSRSMATIVGGYQCGLRRLEAAEYSFLLGFVTLSAATLYEFVKYFDVIFLYFSAKTFLLGISVACLSSMVAIKFLISFIARNGMMIFAWYRIILAILVLCSFFRQWV